MIQLKFIKVTPQGLTFVVYRFMGKEIFIKKQGNNPNIQKVKEQMIQKGADVQEAKNWIKINFIKDQKMIVMAGQEFDIEDKTDQDIENFLADFYEKEFKKGGYQVERK